MPISKEAFDKATEQEFPKLVDFLSKNRRKAYSVKELKKRFGTFVLADLIGLALANQVESKVIEKETYYSWKSKRVRK